MTKARDIARAGTALASVDATELGYLDGVTSNVQTQLNAKQAVVSGVDSTEIGYLDGVTSAIQTQLNAKATIANPTFTGNMNISSSSNIDGIRYVDIYNQDGTTANSAVDVRLITQQSGSTSTTSVDLIKYKNGAFNIINNDTAGTIALATQGTARLNVSAAGATTVTYTTTTGGAVRNIYMSTSTPSGGSDGDVWIQYT